MRVTYQANLLSLKVLFPLKGAAVSDTTVLVSGTFQGPANTGITVNGVVAAQNGEQFMAQVPLQPGDNTVTVTATTTTGEVTTETLNVVSADANPIQVGASATGGMAPLTVNFTVQNNTGNAINKIEADFNGDGTADFSTTDPAAVLQFIYTTPGIYQTRFSITDAQNVVTERTVMIEVQDATKIDQLLKAQWNGMNSALVAGDKATVLSFLNNQAKEKYGPIFDVLLPDMPAIIGSYSAAQTMSITQDIGEYAINRTIDGVNSLFLIYFLRDVDGVWRLDSM